MHGAPGAGLIRAASAEALCVPCHGENPSREGKGPGKATHVIGKTGPACLGCHRVHRTAGGRALLDKAAFEGGSAASATSARSRRARARRTTRSPPTGAACLSCHRMHNAERQGARRGLLAVAVDRGGEDLPALSRGPRGVPAGDGAWNHPLGGSVAADERSLGARLARVRRLLRARREDRPASPAIAPTRGQPGTPQLVTAAAGALPLLPPRAEPARPGAGGARRAPGRRAPAQGAHRRRVPERRRRDGAGGELTCGTCHRAHRGRAGTPGLVLPRESYSCLLCHSGEAAVASTPHGGARAPGAGLGRRRALRGLPRRARLARAAGGAGGRGGRADRADLPLLPRRPRRGAGPAARRTTPLGVSPPSGKGAGGLPLFWTDGRTSRQGLVACTTCHDAHRAGAGGDFLRERAAGRRARAVPRLPRARRRRSSGPGTTCEARGGRSAAPATPCTTRSRSRPGPPRGGAASARPSTWRTSAAAATARTAPPRRPWSPSRCTRRPRAAGQQVSRLRRRATTRTGGIPRTRRTAAAAAGGRGHQLPGPAGLRAGRLCAGLSRRRRRPSRRRRTTCSAGAAGRRPSSRIRGAAASARPATSVHGGRAAAAAGAGRRRDAAPAPARPIPARSATRAGGLAAGAAVGGRGHPVGVAAARTRARAAALRRRRPAPAGGQDRVRDLPRPAPLGAPRRVGVGLAKAASSFLRIGADGYAPLCFPVPRRQVDGRRHRPRPAGDGAAAVNLAGESADASGVCGACHAVHGAGGGLALWNRGFGAGLGRAQQDLHRVPPARTTTRARACRRARRRTW